MAEVLLKAGKISQATVDNTLQYLKENRSSPVFLRFDENTALVIFVVRPKRVSQCDLTMNVLFKCRFDTDGYGVKPPEVNSHWYQERRQHSPVLVKICRILLAEQDKSVRDLKLTVDSWFMINADELGTALVSLVSFI